MGLEAGISGIWDLNVNWPLSSEFRKEGDDHLRLIKNSLNLTFPSINKVITAGSDEINILEGALITTDELNYLQGVTSNVQEQIDDPLICHTDETNTYGDKQQVIAVAATQAGWRMNDISGAGNKDPYIDFMVGGTGNRGAALQNVNSLADPNGYTRLYRKASAGQERSAVYLFENGKAVISNKLTNTYMQIDETGQIDFVNVVALYANGVRLVGENYAAAKADFFYVEKSVSTSTGVYEETIDTGLGTDDIAWGFTGPVRADGSLSTRIAVLSVNSAGERHDCFAGIADPAAGWAYAVVVPPTAPASAGQIKVKIYDTKNFDNRGIKYKLWARKNV
jgi:hypothetical protein